MLQALKLLSVLAAIRLDEKSDKIEHVLFRSLLDGTSAVSGARDRSVTSTLTDPLAASTWEEVQFYNSFLLCYARQQIQH